MHAAQPRWQRHLLAAVRLRPDNSIHDGVLHVPDDLPDVRQGTWRGSAMVEHVREAPLTMTLPLLLLAVPSVLSGLWGRPSSATGSPSSSKGRTSTTGDGRRGGRGRDGAGDPRIGLAYLMYSAHALSAAALTAAAPDLPDPVQPLLDRRAVLLADGQVHHRRLVRDGLVRSARDRRRGERRRQGHDRRPATGSGAPDGSNPVVRPGGGRGLAIIAFWASSPRTVTNLLTARLWTEHAPPYRPLGPVGGALLTMMFGQGRGRAWSPCSPRLHAGGLDLDVRPLRSRGRWHAVRERDALHPPDRVTSADRR